jgi:hypothetical protein
VFGILSSVFGVLPGVLQSSRLGPFLFDILINAISNKLP